MGESVGRRIRKATTILLRCAIIALGAGEQQAVLGAEMAMPLNLAARAGEKPELVASASQAVGDGMIAQEIKSVGTPAEPLAAVQEIKSTARLPSRKLRRRKPKMAGVPAGPLAAQEIKESAPPAVAQETRTDTLVKPQAVAQETEETNPFGPPKSQAVTQETEETDLFATRKPQAGAQGAKPGEEAKPAPSGRKYRMAPVRWGVRVSETLGWLNSLTKSSISGDSSSSSSLKTISNTQTAEIKAATYILQPYIAQMSGGIGVVSSTSRISSTGGTGSAGNDRTNNLFGNGALSLLSRSRFPFDMSFNVSDSRADTELNSEDLVGRALNLRQSYRPLTGPSIYMGSYSRSNSNSKSSGNSANSSWNGIYSTRLGNDQDQPFNADLMHTKSTNSLDGGVLSTNMLTAQHTYLPSDSLLSLNTSASLTRTAQSNMNQLSSGVNSGRFLQANTIASWQPEDEDVPLFVTGSGRIFDALSTSGGLMTVSRSLGGNAAATYRVSRNVSYFANGSVAKTKSGAILDTTTTQNGGATYSSNAVNFWNKSLYIWGANGTVGNQTDSNSGSNHTVSGSVRHNLNGPYALSLFGKKAMLSYGVNQSLGASADRINGLGKTLTNGGTLSWRESRGDALSGGINLSVTDTRTMGKNALHTQTFALSMDEASKYSTLFYGVAVEASLQVTRGPDGQLQTNAYGIANYKKSNVFGVRGLNYVGALNINTQQQPGNSTNTPQYSRIGYALNQRLNYRIGMNEVLLNGYLADKLGLKTASLFLQFRVWRSIGY